MNTATIQYGLHIENGGGLTAWSLITDDHDGNTIVAASGRIDESSSEKVRNRVMLTAIDHIVANAPADAFTELMVFNTTARRSLLEFGDVFGHIRVLTRSEMTRPEWWSGVGKKAARDLLGVADIVETAQPAPTAGGAPKKARKHPVIQAATDGSVAYGKFKAASYGWAREDGRYGFELVKTGTILHAELTAILQLILHADKGERLLVHVDSRNALHAIHGGTGPFIDAGAMRVVRKIHVASRKLQRIEYRWVKAHQGHPLNDAADRLARLARQTKDSCPQAARIHIARNIMADALAAHEASRP